MRDPAYFLRTLRVGLVAAFIWGALVALASKIEIRHPIPAMPWITDKMP